MSFSLHPGAQRDLAEAADFYACEGSRHVAQRFVAEVARVAALIAANPDIGVSSTRGRRVLSMQVFPYAVVYRRADDGIHIPVVRHHRRHPAFGRARG
ncbi:MAG: type II toxin-antitoxin system RelE/ParE family toxin [Betaproteobacteria bacterium]